MLNSETTQPLPSKDKEDELDRNKTTPKIGPLKGKKRLMSEPPQKTARKANERALSLPKKKAGRKTKAGMREQKTR